MRKYEKIDHFCIRIKEKQIIFFLNGFKIIYLYSYYLLVGPYMTTKFLPLL